MGKGWRRRKEREQANAEKQPESSSAKRGIKIWRSEPRQQIASSVARQMQAQGIPIPPNADVVTKGSISGSMIPPDISLGRWRGLKPESPMEVQARILMRKGKKTWVCMGTSPDSCGLAPWHEEGIDEWIGLNDAHQLSFMHMDKITRWYQIHQKGRYMRQNPRYDIDHWAWLQKKQPFPIYMQRHDPDVPSSVAIPIEEISKRFFAGKFTRGLAYQRILEMGSTFSYVIPMAIMEGAQRVEFYGVELAQEVEYMEQRPSTEFWMGIASAHGVEIHVPRVTKVLKAHFYGYDHPQPDETWDKDWRKMENNVPHWEDYPDMNEELMKTVFFPNKWPKAAEAWHGSFVPNAANPSK